jgi:hypothetical protein
MDPRPATDEAPWQGAKRISLANCCHLLPISYARRQGKARQGKARQGKARQGKARQGKARQGKARQGKARQGKAYKLLVPSMLPVLKHSIFADP